MRAKVTIAERERRVRLATKGDGERHAFCRATLPVKSGERIAAEPRTACKAGSTRARIRRLAADTTSEAGHFRAGSCGDSQASSDARARTAESTSSGTAGNTCRRDRRQTFHHPARLQRIGTSAHEPVPARRNDELVRVSLRGHRDRRRQQRRHVDACGRSRQRLAGHDPRHLLRAERREGSRSAVRSAPCSRLARGLHRCGHGVASSSVYRFATRRPG